MRRDGRLERRAIVRKPSLSRRGSDAGAHPSTSCALARREVSTFAPEARLRASERDRTCLCTEGDSAGPHPGGGRLASPMERMPYTASVARAYLPPALCAGGHVAVAMM